MSKAYLILETGDVFEAESFGYEKEVIATLVFSTSMVGYNELLTSPCYYGQMVVSTFPFAGNVGVIKEDLESDKVHLSGYIVREVCEVPSNFRCEGNLSSFLEENKVPAIAGVDTRRLVKYIRDNGTVNAKISFKKILTDEELKEIKDYKITDAVKSVTSQEVKKYTCDAAEKTVVLWDFGTKKSFIDTLLAEGFEVITVPACTTAEEIASFNTDAVILSDGPGNPKDNPDIIEEIRKLAQMDVKILGISLGHELLALAMGADTVNLKYGHIGSSQPVRDEATGRTYITSQNHCYVVDSDTLPAGAKVSFVNVNDSTCEGIEYDGGKLFSVQFHPDTNIGPQDTSFLFDRLK